MRRILEGCIFVLTKTQPMAYDYFSPDGNAAPPPTFEKNSINEVFEDNDCNKWHAKIDYTFFFDENDGANKITEVTVQTKQPDLRYVEEDVLTAIQLRENGRFLLECEIEVLCY